MESWGVWFPPESTRPERLLELWEDGAQLWAASSGWLLVFSKPRDLDTDKISLLPVVKTGDGWASFPSAQPNPGELVLRWQGRVSVIGVNSLHPVELAEIWNSSSLQYLEGQPVRVSRLVEKPTLVRAPEVTQGNVREILSAIPKAAPEQKEWLRNSKRPSVSRESSNPLLGLFDLFTSFFDSKANQRYLSKMMNQFEREEWQDALRHAIPLSDENSREAIARFLGKLAPRKDLSYTAKHATGTSIGTSLSGVELLQRTYERAFLKLERAGKLEEAAFVCAELLNDIDGALRLLERHKLFESAAKLATVKGLPAAQQVRYWFQAGQTDRALELARCHGVHAQALHLLEQRDLAKAIIFRIDWANDLAAGNRLSEAVEVGWTVRSSLPHYPSWLLQVLQGEDLGAAQAMALIATDPKLSRELGLAERLRAWFAQVDPFTTRRQRHLLDQLTRKPPGKADNEVRLWANEVARKVMRQAHTPWALGDNKTLAALVELSGDPWLRADRPKILKSRLRLDRWHQVVEPQGKLPLFDAASLGDGRFLVALGHTGLAVISKRGAYSQRFDQPAHSLVTPLHGDLFLTHSQGRLGYFHKKHTRSLLSVSVDGFADSHDGHVWFVWCENQLFQIDLTSLTHPEKSVWQAFSCLELESIPGRVAVGKNALGVLLQKKISYYDPREMKSTGEKLLIQQRPVLVTPEPAYHSLHHPKNRVFIRGELTGFEYQNNYAIASSQDQKTLTLCIFPVKEPSRQFVVELPGARFAQVRAQDRELVICDSTGRLLVADPESQTWLGQFFL